MNRFDQAFNSTSRKEFLPEEMKGRASEDVPIPIGYKQTISQPSLVRQMTKLLNLQGNERVLDVGTGSGYQAAILSKLCKEVVTIERLAPLAKKARERLKRLQFTNILVVRGDGKRGYPPMAPYDAIIIAAATEKIPQALLDQLKNGGRMIIPLGNPLDFQELTLITKQKSGLQTKAVEPVRFVPLT